MSPLAEAAPSDGGKARATERDVAAAQRLQRQREHMERQRERIKKNRERFRQQRERQRKRLKEERDKIKAGGSDAGCECAEPACECDEPVPDDGDGTDIWSGFFPWKTGGDFSDNLPTGVGLAAMGIIGALILIFGFLGSYLPSMGGKTEYKALLLEIETLTKRRDRLLASREDYVSSGDDFGGERRREATALTQDLTAVIKSKEEEAQRKYRQVMRLGIPIYVLMGGGLAVLLATNALQALLIGFAWTSVIDRLGLKWEEEKKEEVKEESAAKVKSVATERDREVEELEAENATLTRGISKAMETAARIKEEG
ncbi:MAG TPA: hypothetical protein VFJ53_00635 [Solirubrobacterales bacterium]|nr:hypothetical protein [Solirubrobacterales bacterium]